MNITERAAKVLQQIDARLVHPMCDLQERKSLRCLKTAIEGLMKARDATIQLRAHADPLLTTLCNQWEDWL